MKSKFIVNGLGKSGLGDIWLTGHVRYELSNNTIVETEECEIYFADYLLYLEWVANMEEDIVFPEEMKGFR